MAASQDLQVVVPHGIGKDAFFRIVDVVAHLRKQIREQNRRSSLTHELEVRFGRMSEGCWNQLLGSLNLFQSWSSVKDWRETHDIFYCSENGETIRTTRSAGQDGKTLVLAHQKKTRIDEVNLHAFGCRILNDSVRISLNTEELLNTEVLDKTVPFSVQTTCVRIKRRKTFVWNDWQFDITRSWSGVTLEEAQSAVATNQKPSLEFEIELINPARFLGKPDHTNQYVAACLLLRVLGVLPDQKCNFSL